MARSTILELTADIADQLGLQRPLSLFGAYNEGDVSDRKILRALTQTCQLLAADFEWQTLKHRHSFVTAAAEAQPQGLPTDFGRMVLGTTWDETLRRPLCGPLDDAEWAEAKSGTIGRIEPAFTILDDALLMVPEPPAGRTIAFTYIRDCIGRRANGDRITRFQADSDKTLWADDLMIAGAVMCHLMNDHEAYASEQLVFEKLKADAIKRDGGGRVLNMGGASRTSDDMVRRLKSAALIIGGSDT